MDGNMDHHGGDGDHDHQHGDHDAMQMDDMAGGSGSGGGHMDHAAVGRRADGSYYYTHGAFLGHIVPGAF